MINTRKFIEDALEGGWEPSHVCTKVAVQTLLFEIDSSPLLDPLFWQAVGETRGWKTEESAWLKFGVFANHLFSGSTIEEALGKIV